MNPANHKNLATLLSQSFNEMLGSMGKQHALSISVAERQFIQSLGFRSVMCSIAAASFKLNMLLHFPGDYLAASNFIALNNMDKNIGTQEQYLDYISELTNSLCGSGNRILTVSGLSTGMSTPTTLLITNSTLHMNAMAPSGETHMGCFLNGGPLMFASLYLFINEGFENSLVVALPEFGIATENLGELELF